LWVRLAERRECPLRLALALASGKRMRLQVHAVLFRADEEPIAVLTLRELEVDTGARLAAARAAALGGGVAVEVSLLLAPDRRVIAATGRLHEVLGVNAAGAIGVPFEYLVDETTGREFLAACERLRGDAMGAGAHLAGAARAFSRPARPGRLALTVVNFVGYPRVDGLLVRAREIDDHATLRERAQHLRQHLGGYVEQVCDLAMLTDAAGHVAWQSPGIHDLLGLSAGQTEGGSAASLLVEDDRPGFLRTLQAVADAVDGQRRRGYLARTRNRAGAHHTLWFTLRNCLDDPQLGGIVISAVDVSGLMTDGGDARQTRQLELRERLLGLAIQSRADFVQSLSSVLRSAADALRGASAAFWRLDRNSERFVCESLYARAEQAFLRDWVGVDFPERGIVEPTTRLREHGTIALADCRGAEGMRDPRWEPVRAFLSAPVILDGAVIGVVAVTDHVGRRWEDEEVGFVSTSALMVALAVEAAQRVEAEGRIEQLAWYDPLTGLPNRNLARERLREAITASGARRRRLAVLLVDLDRLKDINDTLGHLVGDALIKAAAEVLREGVGARGTVARLGGDEFLVLVEEFAHRQEVAELAQRLSVALHRSDLVPQVATQVSASIGVALYPEHGREAGVLLKHADAALAEAKGDGRNQVSFFNPIRHERSEREARLGRELMRAVQAEKAEFFVEYQPQVEVASGRIVGLEALIRWRHPVHGVLTPDRFIGVAEHGGLSERITRWVLTEVCSQILRWRQLRPGFDIPVAVNVAGRELGSNVLPILVRSTLDHFRIEPRMITLEITERTLVNEGEINNDVVNELAGMGIGLVLDDFGTGYSSLGYLRRMPIRAIKIDRSFIQGVPGDPDSCALVQTMLNLARHFKLSVIAEGVERSEQGLYLRQLGCTFAQGFYYARALPAADLAGHLLAMGA
jgi:diguanylate cyclase (GGDEF)-like protein